MALEELYDSRQVRITAMGKSGTRRFKCLWTEWESVTPRIGEVYPDTEDLFVQEVFCEGVGTNVSGHAALAKLTVNYGTRDAARPVESIDFGGEWLKLMAGRTWVSDSSICTEPTAVYYPLAHISVERSQRWLNNGLIYNREGCINSSIFRGCAPECVRFEGARARNEWTNLGELAWRVQYNFVFRWRSWNETWRADIANWDRVNPPLYSLADLDVLLL